MLVRYPNWMETALLTCAAASLLQALAVERSSRRRWLQGCVLFSLLAAGSLGGREVMRQTSTDLRTTFIDVGQGDAALIEGPRGFAALVDGGGRYDNTFDTGARIVEPVLRARGIAHLDLIVLSHPHPDHMNGLMRILKRFSVGMLWTGGSDGGNPAYWDLIRLAEQQGITMPRPTTLALAALVVEPLGPWRDGEIAAPAGLGANDASIVVRFSYVGRRMLFTGDIQADGEEELLERWPAGHDRDADILKIPHHGSRHSSGERFLEAVSPWLAVVSAGKYNRFGLPNPAALARFASRQIPVLRTDRDGAVIVTISDKGEIRTACELGCQE
jgi:competence protein ComEC